MRENRKSISQIPVNEMMGNSSVPEVRPRGLHMSRPSIAPIEEGKKLTFTPIVSPEPSASGSGRKLGSGGVPFPSGRGGGEAESIGKASDIQAAAEREVPGELGVDVRERLDAIDERQKRIEGMLERLLVRSGSIRGRRGDVTGDDDVFDDT
jgi:hypothetical protein